MNVVDFCNNWTISWSTRLRYMMLNLSSFLLIHTGADSVLLNIWEFTGIPEATVHIFISLDDVVEYITFTKKFTLTSTQPSREVIIGTAYSLLAVIDTIGILDKGASLLLIVILVIVIILLNLFLFFYHTVAIALTNCTHSTNQNKRNIGKTARS